MTDRELLELAAKAAGIRIDKSETNGGGVGNYGFSVTGDAMLDWHNNIRWNPLSDDGDALRLAVKLRLSIDHNHPADQQRGAQPHLVAFAPVNLCQGFCGHHRAIRHRLAALHRHGHGHAEVVTPPAPF